ncbi:MAG: exodeoxyribonuclease V subunit gamma [Burkholderiales bacterium PBB6]|nr:MAG: exodeoxyribonuclease V subunit gamma [Burkholderiales bacterium PBB6]
MHADTPITPGLLVLHGNRAETLADTVLAWLRAHPLAPLEEEVMLVQSNGMAEWLKMTLAQQAGICAAARVELPARFMWRFYRQVLGREQVPQHSVLDKTPLTWRLMQSLPQWQQAPGWEPVAGFLQGGDPDRLLQLCRRLADLFDQYQVYRPDWLQAWRDGNDVLLNPGRPELPVPADQRWQPLLWRALLAEVEEKQLEATRPALHQRVLDVLNSDAPTAMRLPRRVVLFGMTHVPLPTLQALTALGERCQVLMAIPNPCRFHWADIMDGRELLRMQRQRQPLRNGLPLDAVPLSQMHAHAHPLLAAWGRQGRDFVRQLDAFDDAQRALQRFELPRLDLFDEDDAHDAPLLTRVQARVRDMLPLAEHAEAPLADDDFSIVFHKAHSAMREVEVLHDQLLSLLAERTSGVAPLQARDVVVMVPDIEQMAPAIRAVFGQHGRGDARYIPFDIADLSSRHASPMVTALDWLLRLPQQRCRFSELRDLLDVPALGRRFGLSTEDLPQLTQWMEGAGWRWGLHEEQRATLGLGACGAVNSGWWALRRMLLGYASGAADLADVHGTTQHTTPDRAAVFAGIEPYAEVGGLDAELAGSMAQLLDRLAHWWSVLCTPATPADWAARGRALLKDLFQAGDDAERQTLAALDGALDTWLSACAQAGFAAELPVTVLREAWLDTLDEPTLNRRFRAGGVTFCTLMPMRAIPFEVVCLLGMNDGDYPRRAPRSDFDLMGQPGQARPGDRSRRDDDRQLMLEALLSARRALYISWTGRNARDNSEQPPSVLVAQLRDYLSAAWGEPAVAARTFEHPLQPFSRRYFEPGAVQRTWAREWRQAHVLASEAAPGDGGQAGALPPVDTGVPLSLQQLTRFVQNPVKAFFRHRLGVVFDDADEATLDDEAFDVVGLDEHQLVDQLLRDALQALQRHGAASAVGAAGFQPAEWVQAGVARLDRSGRLPLGAQGERTRAQLGADLGRMLNAWQQWQAQHDEAATRQPLLLQHDGVVLQDWLDDLRTLPVLPDDAAEADGAPPPAVWLQVQASRLCTLRPGKPPEVRLPKLVAPWVRSLLAAACGVPVHIVLIGRDAQLTLSPPSREVATQAAQEMLTAWLHGQQQPLPVAPVTALAWLERHDLVAAATAYEGGWQSRGEVAEPCLARQFPDFEALTADLSFEGWAESLYGPLLAWAGQHVQIELHADTSVDTGASEHSLDEEGA